MCLITTDNAQTPQYVKGKSTTQKCDAFIVLHQTLIVNKS